MIILSKTDKFAVSIEAIGFDSEGEEKIRKAARHMCEAFSSIEFKEFCENYIYKVVTGSLWWKKFRTVSNFRWPKRRSRLEVYHHLMKGAELHSPEEDNEADVYLKLDKRNVSGVLGYTYSNSIWQWIYNWFFRSGDEAAIAGNVTHEWTHKMGYNHERRRTPNRKHNVPYAIGYFVRDYVCSRLKA